MLFVCSPHNPKNRGSSGSSTGEASISGVERENLYKALNIHTHTHKHTNTHTNRHAQIYTFGNLKIP